MEQNDPEFEELTESELELVGVAQEHFPDAFELAVNTGDADLFYKVIEKANNILFDKALSSLIDKGLIEMSGVDEEGDFLFSLTDKGREAADQIERDENVDL